MRSARLAGSRSRTLARRRSRLLWVPLLLLAVLCGLLVCVSSRLHPLVAAGRFGEVFRRRRRAYASRYVVSDDGAVFFPSAVADSQIAEAYLGSAGAQVTRVSPHCGLKDVYQRMAWSASDVRSSTVEYYRKSVQLVIITGNYDNYSRVEAARCTWLAHVPPERILFATDRLHVPRSGWGTDGPRGIYRYGTWHASEELAMAGGAPGTRARIDPAAFNFTLGRWGHPPGWLEAQVRFFDGLRFAYEDERSAWAALSDKSHFQHSRWVALLDDDSYVHLDAMTATFMYHDVVALLAHDEYWWREVWSTRMSARVPMSEGRRDWVRVSHRRKASDWAIHCGILQRTNEEERNPFLRLPRFLDECLTLPTRLGRVFLEFLTARGLQTSEAVTEMFDSQARRARIFDEFARTVGNSICFLAKDPKKVHGGAARLLWSLWHSMDEILSATWVRFYLIPAIRLPELTLAGSGTYLNTAAFYRRFMEEFPTPDRATPTRSASSTSYAYEKYCLPYLYGGRASDEAIQSCTREIGIELRDDRRFRDRSLQDYLREGKHAVAHPPGNGGEDVGIPPLAALAKSELVEYAVMHVKMEFFDTMRHRSGADKGMPPPPPSEIDALYRLAHFRMRLYYESVYLRNPLSMLMFTQVGAQARNELVETDETRRLVREGFTRVFLPALRAGRV